MIQELMAAVTGAIWKCASSPENVERFQVSHHLQSGADVSVIN